MGGLAGWLGPLAGRDWFPCQFVDSDWRPHVPLNIRTSKSSRHHCTVYAYININMNHRCKLSNTGLLECKRCCAATRHVLPVNHDLVCNDSSPDTAGPQCTNIACFHQGANPIPRVHLTSVLTAKKACVCARKLCKSQKRRQLVFKQTTCVCMLPNMLVLMYLLAQRTWKQR